MKFYILSEQVNTHLVKTCHGDNSYGSHILLCEVAETVHMKYHSFSEQIKIVLLTFEL